MKKRCKDPVCPANQSPSSSQKGPKSRPKKRSRPTNTKSSSTRSKRRSKERAGRSRRRSPARPRKNKKCQTSSSTVESSTSTMSMRKKAYSPRDSAKRTRRRRSGCRISKCRKKPLKTQQASLCICVRGSSSQNLRDSCNCPSKCKILSKYGDCCCMQNKRNRNGKGENENSTEREPLQKCHCKPSASRPRRNVFARGMSSLRRKIRGLRQPLARCENPRCNEPRVCRSCPLQTCCSNTSKRNRKQNYKPAAKRKVKFCRQTTNEG